MCCSLMVQRPGPVVQGHLPSGVADADGHRIRYVGGLAGAQPSYPCHHRQRIFTCPALVFPARSVRSKHVCLCVTMTGG